MQYISLITLHYSSVSNLKTRYRRGRETPLKTGLRTCGLRHASLYSGAGCADATFGSRAIAKKKKEKSNMFPLRRVGNKVREN